MTTGESIILLISFILSINSAFNIAFNSKDIRELKWEIDRLKDEIHFLKMKNKGDEE